MPNQLFMAIQHIECGFNEKNNNFSLKVNNSKTIEKDVIFINYIWFKTIIKYYVSN